MPICKTRCCYGFGGCPSSALAVGVQAIICPGYDLESSRQAIKLAEKYAPAWAAVGLHPENIVDRGEDVFAELRDLVHHPQVVAVGEIGLDYVNGVPDQEAQKTVFRRQLELAATMNLPAIIHNRESHADLLTTVRDIGPLPQGGVMHCFSGSSELAKECVKLGYYISYAGPVTFKNARRLPGTVANVPADRLLVETDGPYLSRNPTGEKTSRSGCSRSGKLADILGRELEELAPILTVNTKRLFTA